MILLLADAVARPRPPAVDPLLAQEQAACAPDTPEGYQITTGHASHADSATAINQAVANARRDALEAACAGKSELRCAVIRRHVEPWKTPFWNPTSGHACAHVGVARTWLDDDRQDAQALARALADLAGQVVELAKGGPIALRPPLWRASGCAVGSIGSAVEAELANALAAAGPVRLVPVGDTDASTVAVALEPRGADVVLAASIEHGPSGVVVPLRGFTFPADLFAVAESGDDCRFDTALGLVDGQRRGAGGHVVHLTVGGRGDFCDGDVAEARITVDRPSRVQVFSVSRTGTALLVWPPPGGDGLVSGARVLDQLTLRPMPEGGDEKLLAVAVAPGSELGVTDGWTGFCRLPSPLDASSYPATAALSAATFEVLPSTADECAGRPPPPSAAVALSDVPLCR